MNNPTTDPTRFAADRAHLPGWLYVLFMLLTFALGLGALWVNREHAYANLTLLRLPPDALFVRQRSIDLFAAAHLVLFFLVAILPRERFGSLRLRMGVVALAVVGFETAGMWQSRFGIALSGQAAAAADARRIQDLEADIAEARRNAAGLRQSAAGQAYSQFTDSRAAGLDALKQASASTNRANALGAELAALRAGKAPAEADIWGQWMPYKAAAEAILVTLLSMVCFAVAGNMGRAARDVALTRPNLVKSKAAGLPAYSVTMPHPGRAAAGLGAAGAAVSAHASPPYVPPEPSVPAVTALASASKPDRSAEASEAVLPKKEAQTASKNEGKPETHNTGAKKEAETAFGLARPELGQGAPALASASKVDPGSKPAPLLPEASLALAPKQDAEPRIEAKAKSKTPRRAPRTVPVYEEVREAVRSGRVKPSTPALKAEFGGSTPTIKDWQERMEADGIAKKTAAGYVAINNDGVN